MKKRTLAIISLVLVCLMLVACSSSDTSSSSASTETAATPAPAATTEVVEEVAAEEIDYPTMPITVIVPASAGGDTDTLTRIFAQYLGEELGQTIVISNISGMSAALTEVYEAPNDGYTLCSYHPGILVGTQLGTVSMAYDDFSFINIFTSDQQSGWFVSADAPYQTLEELAAAAKEAPVSFATEVGSLSHLTGFDFTMIAEGAEINVVDAGGAADKIVALLGGQLDIMYNSVGLTADYLENGDFVCLGIMAEERTEANPDIPTFKEQGFDMVYDKPYWIFGPADMDQAICDKLNDAIVTVCANEEYVAQLMSAMQAVPGSFDTSAEAMAYIEDINVQYGAILEAYLASAS